jgi:UDP-2,3-diacylglucosamine hydrolase
MATLFVSDVHLSVERPVAIAAFLAFIDGPARRADAVYLLGDIFDQWLGDDDQTTLHTDSLAAIARLTNAGVPVGLFHGNHDFLVGHDFGDRSGCQVLGDSSVIELGDAPALITHGDALCTDDAEYQAFRRLSRDPENQARFLSLPMSAREQQAAELREHSRAAKQLKPDEIMDVNQDAVAAAMREHHVHILIHGHTHRPATHEFDLDGQPAQRIVLGDWYEADHVLVWDANGFRAGAVQDMLAE